MEWMPIETAPKQTDVLVWKKAIGKQAVAEFVDEEWFDDCGALNAKPTHWMPLPQPPQD